MNQSLTISRLKIVMSGLFLVFAAACTFSIALAQTALGLTLAIFIFLSFVNRRELFEASPVRLYIVLGTFLSWSAITSCLGAGGLVGLAAVQSYWLFLALPVGWYLLRSTGYRDRLLMVVAIMVIIVGLAGLLQFFTGVSWPGVSPPVASQSWGYRAQGFFSSRMTYAQVLVPLVLIFSYLGWSGLKKTLPRIRSQIYLAAGMTGAIGIVLSLSRSAMLALIIGLIVMGLFLGRRQLLAIISILVLTAAVSWRFVPDFALRLENTALIDLRDYKVAGRRFIWDKSLELVNDHPWLGVGRSQFQAEYIKRLEADFNDDRIPGDAHSDWLHTAATSGWPGLILFASLWSVVLSSSIKKARSDETDGAIGRAGLIGLAGILVMSVPVSLFEDSEMLQVIILTWILALAGADDAKQPIRQEKG